MKKELCAALRLGLTGTLVFFGLLALAMWTVTWGAWPVLGGVGLPTFVVATIVAVVGRRVLSPTRVVEPPNVEPPRVGKEA